jgi:hypothetical protein
MYEYKDNQLFKKFENLIQSKIIQIIKKLVESNHTFNSNHTKNTFDTLLKHIKEQHALKFEIKQNDKFKKIHLQIIENYLIKFNESIHIYIENQRINNKSMHRNTSHTDNHHHNKNYTNNEQNNSSTISLLNFNNQNINFVKQIEKYIQNGLDFYNTMQITSTLALLTSSEHMNNNQIKTSRNENEFYNIRDLDDINLFSKHHYSSNNENSTKINFNNNEMNNANIMNNNNDNNNDNNKIPIFFNQQNSSIDNNNNNSMKDIEFKHLLKTVNKLQDDAYIQKNIKKQSYETNININDFNKYCELINDKNYKDHIFIKSMNELKNNQSLSLFDKDNKLTNTISSIENRINNLNDTLSKYKLLLLKSFFLSPYQLRLSKLDQYANPYLHLICMENKFKKNKRINNTNLNFDVTEIYKKMKIFDKDSKYLINKFKDYEMFNQEINLTKNTHIYKYCDTNLNNDSLNNESTSLSRFKLFDIVPIPNSPGDNSRFIMHYTLNNNNEKTHLSEKNNKFMKNIKFKTMKNISKNSSTHIESNFNNSDANNLTINDDNDDDTNFKTINYDLEMQIIINSLINQNNIITNQKIDVFNKTN